MTSSFGHGISARGVELFGHGLSSMIPPGANVYFVDSGHSLSSNSPYNGNDDLPFATLDYAIGRCAANQGDHIFVLPGHAETTTGIALDVAGVTVVGLGYGGAKPTFTATTASSDLISVTGDNCVIRGLRLVGAASGVTAILNVNADDFVLTECDILTGAAPVDIITVAGGRRGKILGNTFIGTAAGPDNAIMFEAGSGSSSNWVIDSNLFNYLQFDIDENIIDIPADAHPGLVVTNNYMLGLAVGALTIKSSVANQFGFMDNNVLVAHAAAVTIENLIGVTIEGMFFGGLDRATDTTQTERGINVPSASPA